MFASPDALVAFVLTAELGSFSAAARQLGKRQSTISEAIANLEIDLGVMLFDRQARLPTLSEAGADQANCPDSSAGPAWQVCRRS